MLFWIYAKYNRINLKWIFKLHKLNGYIYIIRLFLPVFLCSFEFSVKSEVLETCKLSVGIRNHVGLLQRNSQIRLLGSVILSLRTLKGGGGFTEW